MPVGIRSRAPLCPWGIRVARNARYARGAYAHERRYARGAYASPARLCPRGHTPRSFWGYIVQEKGEILQAIVEESEEWV